MVLSFIQSLYTEALPHISKLYMKKGISSQVFFISVLCYFRYNLLINSINARSTMSHLLYVPHRLSLSFPKGKSGLGVGLSCSHQSLE